MLKIKQTKWSLSTTDGRYKAERIEDDDTSWILYRHADGKIEEVGQYGSAKSIRRSLERRVADGTY